MSDSFERVFFVGAGASCADGYPSMAELSPAVCYYVSRHPKEDDAKRLVRYLSTVYETSLDDLNAAGEQFRQEFIQHGQADKRRVRLPGIVEVLSALDIFISEDANLGTYVDTTTKSERWQAALDPSELRLVRRAFGRALAIAMRDVTPKGNHAARFVANLSGQDLLISTNWDVILDLALDARRKGHRRADDYGVAARLVQDNGELSPLTEGQEDRDTPRLLKIHGSLNWLECRRCLSLYINPRYPIAHLPGDPQGWRGDAAICDCQAKLSSVIVTPSYVKSYGNHHLAQIWAMALRELTEASQWWFIGYSLPSDDAHIRALLLRAHRAFIELHGRHPEIHVLDRAQDASDQNLTRALEQLNGRYEDLFRSARLHEEGFGGWLAQLAGG